MTIPISDHNPSGVLDITSHFFEFIPEAEATDETQIQHGNESVLNPCSVRGSNFDRPITLAAHELKEGEKYYILPTTAFGLYRYHIHDLVRVTGFYNQTPLVEFLSKGAHFGNITGEKLSEYHVTQSMQEVLQALDLPLTSYTLAPCWDDETPYYGLFVERGDFLSPHQ